MRSFKTVAVFLSLLVVFSGGLVVASGSNDRPQGASEIDVNESQDGSLSSYDDEVDWWEVYIPDDGMAVVFLDGSAGNDIDLSFYDSDLDSLAGSDDRGGFEYVHGSVARGTHYVKVEFYEGFGNEPYILGVLFQEDPTGHLERDEVDVHQLYMDSDRDYWIFLLDDEKNFDPDMVLAAGEHFGEEATVVASSDSSGDADVIRYNPDYSEEYWLGIGAYEGSGYYYVLVESD